MFESAELGRKIGKRKFDIELAKLRPALLEAQFAMRKTSCPVIVIVSGADGAGKGEVVHRLNEWLDPRGVDTQAFWQFTDEEKERPRYWKFWRALPARGRIGILFGSWYSEPIVRRVYGKTKNSELDGELDRIAFFEKMLAEDGAVIVKVWLHLSKKAQRRRLKDLEEDPRTHWRVLPLDWKHYKLYDRFIETSERAIRRTDTATAPWHLVEAEDRRYCELTVGQLLLQAMQQRLKHLAHSRETKEPAQEPLTQPGAGRDRVTILDHVDLARTLKEADYSRQLSKLQGRLTRLTWAAWEKKVASVVVFEGWDGAGKGSAIRRVTAAIDPRLFRIVPVAAPNDEERARHYLWRFWRHLPRLGTTTIFDRSWYGRVLVERVEGFARAEEWRRSYLEINDFEEQLSESGVVVTKFWIHISASEQLKRFKLRELIAFKRHKITAEDWRNRKKWDLYKEAVNDMVARTSTEYAPWTLVPGNDKRFARIHILKTLCDHLDAAL